MNNDPILQNILQAKVNQHADRISKTLKRTAAKIEKELKGCTFPGEEQPVFALFVMAGGAAQYISNGNRDDIKTVVASVLNRWEDKRMHKEWHKKSEEERNEERKDPL